MELFGYDNIKFTGFQSISHLTNYIITNEVISSKHVFALTSELSRGNAKVLALIHANSNLIPLENQSTNSTSVEILPLARSLNLVYSQDFWDSLILLYFTKFHPIWPYLNLKTFNPLKVSTNLLTVIYFAGYQFSSSKTAELTNYMETLRNLTLKKCIFKINLSNLQALLILTTLYQLEGDLKLSRICLALLTRMCYSLGINLDTVIFPREQVLERKLLHRRIAIANYNLSRNFQLSFDNNSFELPKFDPSIYDQLFNLNITEINIKDLNLEAYLITLNLTKLNLKFANSCLYAIQLIPTKIQTLVQSQITTVLELLAGALKEYEQNVKELANNWSFLETKIFDTCNQVELMYYDLSLSLLNTKLSLNLDNTGQLRRKALILVHKMTQKIFNIEEFNQNLSYYGYLAALHYFKLINWFDGREKQDILSRLADLRDLLRANYTNNFKLDWLILDLKFKEVIA